MGIASITAPLSETRRDSILPPIISTARTWLSSCTKAAKTAAAIQSGGTVRHSTASIMHTPGLYASLSFTYLSPQTRICSRLPLGVLRSSNPAQILPLLPGWHPGHRESAEASEVPCPQARTCSPSRESRQKKMLSSMYEISQNSHLLLGIPVHRSYGRTYFHLPDQIIPGNCEKDPMPLDITSFFHYNVLAIGVWRSLVSRLVRVQEAAGSNPATPTKKKNHPPGWFFFLVIEE